MLGGWHGVGGGGQGRLGRNVRNVWTLPQLRAPPAPAWPSLWPPAACAWPAGCARGGGRSRAEGAEAGATPARRLAQPAREGRRAHLLLGQRDAGHGLDLGVAHAPADYAVGLEHHIADVGGLQDGRGADAGDSGAHDGYGRRVLLPLRGLRRRHAHEEHKEERGGERGARGAGQPEALHRGRSPLLLFAARGSVVGRRWLGRSTGEQRAGAGCLTQLLTTWFQWWPHRGCIPRGPGW